MYNEVLDQIKIAAYKDEMGNLDKKYLKKYKEVSKEHPVGKAIAFGTLGGSLAATGGTSYAVARRLAKSKSPVLAIPAAAVSGIAAGLGTLIGGSALNRKYNPFSKKMVKPIEEYGVGEDKVGKKYYG